MTRPRRHETVEELHLRQRLASLLTLRGLRQRDVVQALGVQRGNVCNVLSGEMALPPAWVPTLSGLLQVPTHEIVGDWKPRRPGQRSAQGLVRRVRVRRRAKSKRTMGERPFEVAIRTRLRSLMDATGVPQIDIARNLNVNRSVVSNVFCNWIALPRAWFRPLAKMLGITQRKLLAGIPDGKSKRVRTETSEDKRLRVRLYHLMLERGFNQRRLAMSIGVRPSSLSNVLIGRHPLPLAWVPALVLVLQTTEQQLLCGWKPRSRRRRKDTLEQTRGLKRVQRNA